MMSAIPIAARVPPMSRGRWPVQHTLVRCTAIASCFLETPRFYSRCLASIAILIGGFWLAAKIRE
jgi:hypothetical protein